MGSQEYDKRVTQESGVDMNNAAQHSMWHFHEQNPVRKASRRLSSKRKPLARSLQSSSMYTFICPFVDKYSHHYASPTLVV